MATFRSLKVLNAYMLKNLPDVLRDSMELERELSTIMAQAVVDVVYGAYDPHMYERRTNGESLSDPRSMAITDVIVESNGQVRVVFENLAKGADTLEDEFLVDTIEEGIEANWMKSGEWSKPRPFVSETAERIRQNPSTVVNAVKQGLREKGFTIK